MKEKYYLAYGSNLSIAQMVQRCPNAVYVGKASIKDYQLLFKGSLSGNYLTIEEKKGSEVPVLVWKITEWDEERLDCYEGFPTFYYKKVMRVEVTSLLGDVGLGCVDAVIYIMHEERRLGCPSPHYYSVCEEGYSRFGFDVSFLENALKESVGKREAAKFLKEVEKYDAWISRP